MKTHGKFFGTSPKAGAVCFLSHLAGFGAARTISADTPVPFLFFAFIGLACILISFHGCDLKEALK